MTEKNRHKVTSNWSILFGSHKHCFAQWSIWPLSVLRWLDDSGEHLTAEDRAEGTNKIPKHAKLHLSLNIKLWLIFQARNSGMQPLECRLLPNDETLNSWAVQESSALMIKAAFMEQTTLGIRNSYDEEFSTLLYLLSAKFLQKCSWAERYFYRFA